MKKNYNYKLAIAIIFLLFGVVGCGSFGSMPAEKQVVISYQAMGEVLESSKPALMAMCENGTFDESECKAAREAYNEAVAIYTFLGDAAIVAIDSGDLTGYRTVSERLILLLDRLQKLTGGN
jgi:hypothetical protein